MKKYGRILLVGWVSLAVNLTHGSEEDVINKTIENLSQHFVNGFSHFNQDMKYNFTNIGTSSKLIAPLYWGYFISSHDFNSSQKECLKRSLTMLRELVRVCTLEEKEGTKEMKEHIVFLKNNMDPWKLSIDYNVGFIQRIIDLYDCENENKKETDLQVIKFLSE